MYFLNRAILCHHIQAPVCPRAGSFQQVEWHKNSSCPDITGTLWTLSHRDRSHAHHHENSHCYAFTHVNIHHDSFLYPHSFFHRHCHPADAAPSCWGNFDLPLYSCAYSRGSKHAYSSHKSAHSTYFATCPTYALSKSTGASDSLSLRSFFLRRDSATTARLIEHPPAELPECHFHFGMGKKGGLLPPYLRSLRVTFFRL
jgi:hypothetical protein